ncbi:MAG: hypothetical protein LBM41_05740 [Ruminococcus sp.]|jgi:hypothetical protein|nr:hypothetical protein [Ruminococcus sp.]
MARNEREKTELKKALARWAIYLAAAFLASSLMWSAGGRLPLLMIPLSAAVAAFETPVRSAVFGCVCGLMLDNCMGNLFGFYGILLLWTALFISVLFTLLLRRHGLNVFFLNAAASGLLLFLHYFFYMRIWGYDDSSTILLTWYLPIFILTAIFAVPVFYMVKFLKIKLSPVREVTLEEKSEDITRE